MSHFKVEVKLKRKGLHRVRIVSAYNPDDAVMVFCQKYGHTGPGAFAWCRVTPLSH